MSGVDRQTLNWRLNRIRRFVTVFYAIGYGLLAISFGLLWCVFWQWLDRLSPLQETTAAWLLAVGGLGTLAAFAWGGLRLSQRKPTVNDLAKKAEELHPEWMDSFACAVELERKESLNALEEKVLETARCRLEGQDVFWRRLADSMCRPPWAITLLLPCLALCNVLWGRFVAKGVNGIGGALGMGTAGLEVAWPEAEWPIHSDVPLEAQARRWEKELSVEIRGAGRRETVPMFMDKQGRGRLVFYDVTEPLEYRVKSPSLRTSWRALTVYEPPRYTSVKLTVRPPRYTRQPELELSDFQDLVMVEGTEFELTVEMPSDVTGTLRMGDEEWPLSSAVAGRLTGRWVPKASATAQLVLTDATGHKGKSPSFEVKVQLDAPPNVTVREPKEDNPLHQGESLGLDMEAEDDFGLTDLILHYSVNGEKRQPRPLRQDGEGRLTQWELFDKWNLKELELKSGDMISGYVTVTDNREPMRQETRSPLFFAVLLPDKKEVEGQAGGNDMKEADLSDLTAESKRLIRQTWDHAVRQSEVTPSEMDMLSKGLHQLELAIRTRFNELAEEEDAEGGAILQSFAEQIGEELLLADRLQLHGEAEAAIPPQEHVLSILVRLETEMMKNYMRGEQGSSDKKEESGSKGESEPRQEEQREERLREELEALRMNLGRLMGRQESLNQLARRPDAQLPSLGDKQQELERETVMLSASVHGGVETQPLRRTLRQAAGEMHDGGQAYHQGQGVPGGIHGARAAGLLADALAQTEELLRQSAVNQMQELAAQAGQLGERQREAAAQSAAMAGNKPDREEQGRLRQEQENLSNGTEELLRRIQRQTDALEEDFPEVARALRQSMDEWEGQGVQAMQKRAQNALLYRRFDKAEQEQTAAAQGLEMLKNEIQTAAEALPKMDQEALRAAMKQLQELSRQTETAMRQKDAAQAARDLEAARRKGAELLGQMGETLGNQPLKELSGNLAQATSGQGDGKSIQVAADQTLESFSAAMMVIGAQLEARQTAASLKRRTAASPPPVKYRRLVETYFHELSK